VPRLICLCIQKSLCGRCRDAETARAQDGWHGAGCRLPEDFSAILHPKGAQMENVRDETRRKKDAQSGEPVDTEEGHDSLQEGDGR